MCFEAYSYDSDTFSWKELVLRRRFHVHASGRIYIIPGKIISFGRSEDLHRIIIGILVFSSKYSNKTLDKKHSLFTRGTILP